jgi:undecaprenyl-diphosphatase
MEIIQEIIQAIVYGIVQGIGEFLPISSTAHLILIPQLTGWPSQGTAFNIALHVGTAAAVILFFYKDWLRLFKAGFTDAKSQDGKLFWFIVIATIPGGIAGLLLDKYMESLENPVLISAMLIIMGIVLYFADKLSVRKYELEDIGFKRSIIVGISQAIAIIPGVSRSGVTISAGRLMGMTREGIAKFTFLLSTPIIFLDALFQVKDIKDVQFNVLPFVIAILTAAVVGALSIKFLLNYLKKHGFGIFVIYRFVLGAVVLIMYFAK